MRPQHILHTLYSGVRIDQLANEPFDGSSPYGPFHVTHRGTLPDYEDLMSLESEAETIISERRTIGAAKKEGENKIKSGSLESAQLLVDLIEVLIKTGGIKASDFPPGDRSNYQQIKNAVDKYKG